MLIRHLACVGLVTLGRSVLARCKGHDRYIRLKNLMSALAERCINKDHRALLESVKLLVQVENGGE